MENTPQSPFGKMFPAHLVPIKEKISESFSKNSAKLKEVTPLFLDLRNGTENPRGTMQDSLWETGFQSLGESLMQNFGGVPQRRRRIFLVADFGGQGAGQVLFEREGLSRSFAESRETWQGFTHSLANCPSARVWDARGNGDGETCSTLTGDHENRITDYTNVILTGVDLFNQSETGDVAMTMCAKNGDYNHVPCIIVFNALQDPIPNDQVAPCLSTGNPKTGQSNLALAVFSKGTRPHNKDEAQVWNESLIANCLNVNDIGESRANEIIVMATQQGGAEIGKDLCPTITAAAGMSGNNQPVFCYALDRSSFNQGMNAQYDIGIDGSGIAHTLVAKGPGAVAYGIEIGDRIELAVRRATPTECGRLQGMPDWWCEDVPHSDSAEYKMWGNGMALPNVLYVMEGVVLLLSLRMLDSILEVLE